MERVKTTGLLTLLMLIAYAFASPIEEFEPRLAETCSSEKCELPNCRCSGLILPAPEFKDNEKAIPQFVTLTFDDAVNPINFKYYEDLFKDLVNPDNCSAQATFFISHEYTDYTQVNALYNAGHEIALHSITHGYGNEYWREADLDTFLKEFGQQMQILHQFAKINTKNIKGMRMPFLQTAGNNSFIAGKQLGLLYDSSMPTQRFYSPPMWPYTLDYKSKQECQIGPCPDASISGFWEYPMVTWEDKKGYKCSMVDACIAPPKDDKQEIFDWLMENFNRHYESNRAPFGIFMHAAWFLRGTHNFEALKTFLHHVTSLPDVYVTTPSRVIQWMKHPVPGKPFKGCYKKHKTTCKKVSCKAKKGPDGGDRYLTVCDQCPQTYPWLDNPLGLANP